MHGVNKLSFNHIKRDKHNLLHKIHSSPFSFFDVDHNTLEVFTQFLRRPKYLHRYLPNGILRKVGVTSDASGSFEFKFSSNREGRGGIPGGFGTKNQGRRKFKILNKDVRTRHAIRDGLQNS